MKHWVGLFEPPLKFIAHGHILEV